MALFGIIAAILLPYLSDLKKMNDKTNKNSHLRWKAIEIIEKEKAGIPFNKEEIHVNGENYFIEKIEIKRNNSEEILIIFKEEDGDEAFRLSALRP